MEQHPVLLKVSDVARMFSVHPSTVYGWARRNEIPHTRRGRTIRFSHDVTRPTGRSKEAASVD